MDPSSSSPTVTMPHEDSTSVPPRKRARTADTLFDGEEGNPECALSPVLWKRDEKYYMDGDDCVIIRVEDTLFRVHKFLLARDNSAFADMLSLPCGSQQEREGSSDRNPITLFGDTPSNFRILLSVLYALPRELQSYSAAFPPVATLLTITYMTNKYHFNSTCSWALDTLHAHFANQPPLSGVGFTDLRQKSHHLQFCPPYMYVRILEQAVMCGHKELETVVLSQWRRRLTRDLNVASSISKSDVASWAIYAGEKWGPKDLAGIGYYILILIRAHLPGHSFLQDVSSGTETPSNPGIVTPPDPTLVSGHPELDQPPPRLTAAQGVRLLCGHYSLQRYLEGLKRAPSFQKSDGCTYHQNGCIHAFNAAWQRAYNTCSSDPPIDVVRKLIVMEEKLKGEMILDDAMTPACRTASLTMVKGLIVGLCRGSELVKLFDLEAFGFVEGEGGNVSMKTT